MTGHHYRKQFVVAVIIGDTDGVVSTRRALAPCNGRWVMPGAAIRILES